MYLKYPCFRINKNPLNKRENPTKNGQEVKNSMGPTSLYLETLRISGGGL